MGRHRAGARRRGGWRSCVPRRLRHRLESGAGAPLPSDLGLHGEPRARAGTEVGRPQRAQQACCLQCVERQGQRSRDCRASRSRVVGQRAAKRIKPPKHRVSAKQHRLGEPRKSRSLHGEDGRKKKAPLTALQRRLHQPQIRPNRLSRCRHRSRRQRRFQAARLAHVPARVDCIIWKRPTIFLSLSPRRPNP